VLRHALTEYLGRVRGVQADPGQIFITSGFVQARAILCRALAARSGATRIAVETPGYNDLSFARQAGMRPCPVPVDEQGMQIARLAKTRARIVMVTPAHQFPTGAVMSGSRRAQLLSWLRDHDALAIEDDYDSEFRYDHAPVGALQGLEPNRVIYAGTASKTLAPALRLGWMVVPVHLIDSVRAVQADTDYGSPRIEQHSFAHLLKSGEFDRHVRRMRSIYRARRDAMVDALARELPEAQLLGIAAGLHVTVRLPASDNLSRIRSEAQRRGLAFDLLSDYSPLGGDFPPAILLGYARHSEEGITRAVRELAMIVRARRKPA